MYYIYGLLGLDRRTFVGSELPEYFFLYQFALNKMACFTSLGYFWTFSRLLGLLWMSLVQKNWCKFASIYTDKGGLHKNKADQAWSWCKKLHLVVFCINCIRITIKISKLAIKNMKFVVKNMKFAIKNMKFSIQNMKFPIQNMKFSIKTMKISI